ncbi:hypothetical protein ACFVT9_33595 [Kitasatospora cineracea]|uniref:hypothetical protein n=1 Tax=Kitasatospora cineracea TaxID=88074 RepID=UPI0036DC7E79
MPALTDLASRAGDLLAVEVDAEVVPVEALVLAVLAGGVARQRPADGDLVFAGGSFEVDEEGVAAVDQVLVGQQSAACQVGVDAGQGLGVVGGGRGGGHVRDHVDAVGGARFGEVGGEALPSDEVAVANVARRDFVGRNDRRGGVRQPAVIGGAPA